MWTTPAIYYSFVPENPEIVMVCTDNEFKIINISSSLTILSIPLGSWTSILDVDPDSKIVVLFDSYKNKLLLYNYQTGLKVRSFAASWANYYLKNSTLYSPQGFKIPLAL